MKPLQLLRPSALKQDKKASPPADAAPSPLLREKPSNAISGSYGAAITATDPSAV
jgi:hypothetical protein